MSPEEHHQEELKVSENEKWETDEEILQGDYPPPYDRGSYAMQKWAGLGFPEGYMAKANPEKYDRRRRIYRDYLNGLRPTKEDTAYARAHQIKLKKYLESSNIETEENTRDE